MARSTSSLKLPLAAVCLLFGALRAYAASRVGFGDSEALYASYALHPQPAYLDHPGLVGIVARALGSGGAPPPSTAHGFTTMVATLAPWLGVGAARAFGATTERALAAGLVFAVVPELAVGLFALTPDLLLMIAWMGALALAAIGLRGAPSSGRASLALLGAGVLAGIAITAKISGVALWLALAATYATRSARSHARTIWPWAGLAAGALAVLPVASWEIARGFPMLRHRLVDTQGDAGISLRNLGQVVGGQLAYVSPVLAVAAVLAMRELWRKRRDGGAPVALSFFATAVPLALLLPLSLWSRVAEPHWLAPALLALPLFVASDDASTSVSPKVMRWGLGTALAMSLAAHAYVLVPAASKLVPQDRARLDIAQELYGWPDAIEGVRELVASPLAGEGTVVVGPHWTICAQLHAALGPKQPVGCMTPVRDDFDDWLPRDEWKKASSIVIVTDARFPVDLARELPKRAAVESRRVLVWRGGKIAREFRLILLGRAAAASISPPSSAEPSL